MAGGQVAEEGVRKGGDENNIGVAIVEDFNRFTIRVAKSKFSN